ncbi:PucR family transcriptional regulator [Pseudoflavonifractor sp.]|jgi:hypothetical protein|uniref:PucR family transcriptional regulator n=1 Tax=Pseudoflavonifractor sp. TaxID=1980281 RepID=UPI003D93C2D1
MLSVKSLLGLECFRRITLEAGKNGLHRRISWPNIAQTASIREWLVGGDVILMSGVGLDHSAAFLNNMIEQAVAGDAACLIILLHRDLIPEIPAETVAYADKQGFPLFSAPWDLQLATLIGEVSTLILQDQYGENLMNELLEMLLFKRELIPEDLMPNLVDKYRLKGPHIVVASACSWVNAGVDLPMRLAELPIRRQVNSMMIQTLRGAFSQTYYINRDWNMIFLIGLRPGQERQLRQALREIQRRAAEAYHSLRVCFGAGNIYRTPELFARSCQEAAKSLSLCGEESVTFFSDLGIFQLLMELPDQRRVREYAAEQLAPLLEYDAKYKKNLLRTLEIYLQTNCSCKKTAEIMYLHRNTLTYQIDKIRSLLGVSLEEAEVRNHFYNCLKLYRYSRERKKGAPEGGG